jgi:hypothetical protein
MAKPRIVGSGRELVLGRMGQVCTDPPASGDRHPFGLLYIRRASTADMANMSLQERPGMAGREFAKTQQYAPQAAVAAGIALSCAVGG